MQELGVMQCSVKHPVLLAVSTLDGATPPDSHDNNRSPSAYFGLSPLPQAQRAVHCPQVAVPLIGHQWGASGLGPLADIL